MSWGDDVLNRVLRNPCGVAGEVEVGSAYLPCMPSSLASSKHLINLTTTSSHRLCGRFFHQLRTQNGRGPLISNFQLFLIGCLNYIVLRLLFLLPNWPLPIIIKNIFRGNILSKMPTGSTDASHESLSRKSRPRRSRLGYGCSPSSSSPISS